MICVACGMQSQDFIPESFDAEEGLEVLRIGGQIRHNTRSIGQKPKKGANIPKADTVDFLVAYQFCLQLMTKSFVAAASSSTSTAYSSEYDQEHYTEWDYLHESSKSSSSSSTSSSSSSSSSNSKNNNRDASTSRHIESISSVVKDLWSGYLDAWSKTKFNITSVFDNKGVQEEELNRKFDRAQQINDHPLYPSRPLLLGKEKESECPCCCFSVTLFLIMLSVFVVHVGVVPL
jgi:hypothetical protein